MKQHGRRKWMKTVLFFLAAVLIFPGTVLADEKAFLKATFRVEKLDEGMKLYALKEGESGLTSAEEGDLFVLPEYGDRIYFYIGAEPGYQISQVGGLGISYVPDLTADTDAPGADEARALGCTKWMSFTHTLGVDVLNRTIYVWGKPIEYHVVYRSDGVMPPSDQNAYTVEEGSNVITLAPGPEREGYLFEGWELGEKFYQPGDTLTVNGELAAQAEDSGYFIFTARWTPAASYTVEYYLEVQENTYPEEPNLRQVCEGARGGSVVRAELAPEGLDLSDYVLDDRYEGTMLSGKVAEDGSLTLRVYYALDKEHNGIPDKYEPDDEDKPGDPEKPGTGEDPGAGDSPSAGDGSGSGQTGDGDSGNQPGGGQTGDGQTGGSGSGSQTGGSGAGGGSGSGGQTAPEVPEAQQPALLPEEPEEELPLQPEEMDLDSSSASGSGSGTGESSAESYSLLELGTSRAPAEDSDGSPVESDAAQGETDDGAAETESVEDDGTPLAGSRLGRYPCMTHWVILFLAVVSALGFYLAARSCRKRIRQLEQELGRKQEGEKDTYE